MKTKTIGIVILALVVWLVSYNIASLVYSEQPGETPPARLYSTAKYVVQDTEVSKKPPKSVCPTTLMSKECLDCHTIPSFKLKEEAPDAQYVYPNGNTHIVGNVGWFTMWQPTDENTQKFFRYINWHTEITHVIFEIHSPGGALFDAWKMVGLMLEWEKGKPGRIVETRVYGLAASAGSLVFMAGTPGHRFVSPNAELMFHELLQFQRWVIESPSDKEDAAKVLRHLQDNLNGFIAERSNIKREDLDKLMRKKEYWLTGKDAVEVGIASGIIGGK